jgi:hypothetical protein
MKLPIRISVLFFIGLFAAGSTALGYYYYFVYSPPLKAAAHFMDDMEKHDEEGLKADVLISNDIDEGQLVEPAERDLKALMAEPFRRGRILDQRRLEGKSRDLYYLVYREPDGAGVYALIATEFKGRFRIVIPAIPGSRRHRYLWEYQWTN